MDASFWHNKWEINQIGFHEKQANAFLVKHLDALKLETGSRIFLPLCGKTLDIAYLLEKGFRVVGIELSEIAIDALFNGLKITAKITQIDKLKHYKAENIDIFVGDFFDLTSSTLGGVDAIYDRASLIALPPQTRKLYSQHLIDITGKAPQLLISLDYEQTIMNGPPFSISSNELEEHYAQQYQLVSLESAYSKNGLKGQYPVTENVWTLTTK